MKIGWLMLAMAVSYPAFADELAGLYRPPCNDPVGCGEIMLLPDHTFVVAAFGVWIAGEWTESGGGVRLAPFVPKRSFFVIGKHNPQLESGAVIRFLYPNDVSNTYRVRLSSDEKWQQPVAEQQQLKTIPRVLETVSDNQVNDMCFEAEAAETYRDGCHTDKGVIYRFANPKGYNDIQISALPAQAFPAAWVIYPSSYQHKPWQADSWQQMGEENADFIRESIRLGRQYGLPVLADMVARCDGTPYQGDGHGVQKQLCGYTIMQPDNR